MAIITLSTPADVSIGTFDAWTDTDVSGITGYTAAVTGVCVQIRATTASNEIIGVRKNGSTDARLGIILGQSNGAHLMAYIGVDGSGIFEQYADSGNVEMFVVAFLTEDTFFTNGVDKSTGSTAAWTDVDISGDTGGATATYAWFEWSTTLSYIVAVRTNGSTDDRRAVATGRHNWAGTGLDGSEICEQYINNVAADLILVGYGNTTMTWNTNAIDRSTGTISSFQAITSPGATAIAAIYDVYLPSASADLYSIRRVGDTVDLYHRAQFRAHFTSALDSTNQQAEQKIGSTNVDVYELGYWTASGTTAYELDAQPGSITLTGVLAGTVAARPLNAATGSYALTGVLAGLASQPALNAAPGTFVITGVLATLPAVLLFDGQPGTYALTGVSAGLAAQPTLNAAIGAYSLTGVLAGVTRQAGLNAAPGAYTLTGIDATLVDDVGGGVAYELDAAPGTLTLTGVQAGLAWQPVLDAQPAAFTLTGSVAGVSWGPTINAAPGSFTITGVLATVPAAFAVAANVGAYTVTGIVAALDASSDIAIDWMRMAAVGVSFTGLTSVAVTFTALSGVDVETPED